MMERSEFFALVYSMLELHPEWIGDAVQAVSSGAQAAVSAANQRAAASDQAMLAALVLANEKRIGDDLLTVLRARIAGSIDAKHSSPVERRFLKDNCI